MGDVVAFQQLGEDPASAEGVGFKRDEDNDRWGGSMVGFEEVLVESRDQSPW